MTTMLPFLAVWVVYMSVVTLLLARFGSTLLHRYRATTVNALWVFVSIAWLFPLRPALPTKIAITTPTTIGTVMAESGTKVAETAVGWQWTSLVLGFLALVWAVGSVVELARTWMEQRRFGLFLKRWGRPVTDRKTLSVWEQESTRLGLTTTPEVWSLPQISSPMVIGFRHARLVIPAGVEVPPRLVLRHEAAHIRRRDPLLRLILRMVSMVHWWNPLARLAVRSALQSAEIACDEKALNGVSQDQRTNYADLLVTALHNQHQTVPLAPSFKERKKS